MAYFLETISFNIGLSYSRSPPSRPLSRERFSDDRSIVDSEVPSSSDRPSRSNHHRRRSESELGPHVASGSGTRHRPIYFYHRHDPYFEFTNFSDHAIIFENEWYPTAEHLFQAHKFLQYHPGLAKSVRNQPTPRRAREDAARLHRLQRPDWFDVNVEIMDCVLYLKFTQHPDLAQMLVQTGDSELIEDSPDDVFWGIGRDKTGRNELGKALMRIRARLTEHH